MPQGNTNNTETQGTYLNYLNNYFGENGERPFCREERQYALFLYNKLLKMVGKKISEVEDNNIYNIIFDIKSDKNAKPIIKNVYYS